MGLDDAWYHYCTEGYPTGMFLLLCKQDAVCGPAARPLGERALQLMCRACQQDPFDWLATTAALGVDPFPVVQQMDFHTGII